MKRAEYLSNTDVKSFIKWLKPRLDTGGLFVHHYLERRSGQCWRCISIYDAFEKYQWSFGFKSLDNRWLSGSSFSENNKALSGLRKQLRIAVRCGDTAPLLAVSCMIFEWGKVTAGNIDWARRDAGNLYSIYQKGMTVLDPKTADDSINFPFRFNSGLTKIYSLLLDDFVIYDSRVGAALGHLVVQYCQAQCFKSVPRLLRFPWAPAKEANQVNPKNRNPSIEHLILEQIKKSQEHACWNLRANWLLKEVVAQSKQFSEQSDPLRALEAALFMIGYDLGGNNKELQPARSFTDQKERTENKYPLTTHGRGFAFRVDFNSQRDALIFSYPKKSNGWQRPPDEFTLNNIYNICVYLCSNFNFSAFPLANKVELLKNRSEKPGLGMAIRTLPETVLKAQASSYLGPYLEEVGVFKLVSPRPAKWMMILKPEDIIPLIHSYYGNKLGDFS